MILKDHKISVWDSILPGLDNKIGPGKQGLPDGPPKGFKKLLGPTSEVSAVAKKLLGGTFGTMTPFQIDGVKYMARVEPHYNPLDYKGGPQGWHKGVTVYLSDEPNVEFYNTNNLTPTLEYSPEKPRNGRTQLLQRMIDDTLDIFK